MSQAFKSRYDQLHENDPTERQGSSKVSSPNSEERYDTEAHARNVCFVLQTGRRVFLNYGYLISGDFEPSDSTITLTFTSHIITLSGQNLERLFYDLMQFMPKQIIEVNSRYNSLADPSAGVANQINIELKE